MAEQLLMELEAFPVAERMKRADLLVSDVIQDVARSVESMKGTASLFGNVWQVIVKDVASGKTAEMHALRPQLWAAFTKRLDLLKHTHQLAAWLRKLDSARVPDPDVLLPEIAALQQFQARVFDPWQSPEDLEDLSARDYPLTTADLDRIGPQRPPPASWCAEKSKPF